MAQRVNEQNRWEDRERCPWQMRATHGPDAISLGPRSTVPGGYLRSKNRLFSRIPDQADFGRLRPFRTRTQIFAVLNGPEVTA